MLTRRHFLATGAAALAGTLSPAAGAPKRRRYLYVASPGVRNYVEYGGVGVLVFDVDDGHKFVRRIPTWDEKPGEENENVKGICACAKTGRLYVSTIKRLLCLDLTDERKLWERAFPGGCDRMSITPDGETLFVPSLEGPIWTMIDAATGEQRRVITLNSGAHNTVCGVDGRYAYLAGLKSSTLTVVDAATGETVKSVGPFGNVVRPFTVNAAGTRVLACVNELLGFEVGDLETGKVLDRVEVYGFKKGPVKRHGCPSHGVGYSPDEKEIWVCDAFNQRVHLFDNTRTPPRQVAAIKLREEPGWVTFSLDGRRAYPSTGEVIELSTRKTLTTLQDEKQRPVMSEKLLEIDFEEGKPVLNGDQFGLGRKVRG